MYHHNRKNKAFGEKMYRTLWSSLTLSFAYQYPDCSYSYSSPSFSLFHLFSSYNSSSSPSNCNHSYLLFSPLMDGLEPKMMMMRSDKVKREGVADCVDNQNGYLEQDKKKKVVSACAVKKGSATAGGGSGGNNNMRCCQAEKCNADLHDAKQYHRRHKVCEYHAKAQVVLVGGMRQRFCQQCSRFHELAEFDDTKRSCRRRLAGHNERRRKNSDQSQAEGSSRKGTVPPQLKDIACGQADDKGRIQITIQENAAYKHFQIR